MEQVTWHVNENPTLRRNVACATRTIFFARCQGGDLHNLKQEIAVMVLATNGGSPPPSHHRAFSHPRLWDFAC